MRPKGISESIEVDWDHANVRVRTSGGLGVDWNRDFSWADITRVCFEDGGLAMWDVLYLEIRGQDELVIVPTDAQRGTGFLDELVKRDIFPNAVFMKAIQSTRGRVYCWPPHDPPVTSP
jgi:hypothetical protein